jgi:hypothetical protein
METLPQADEPANNPLHRPGVRICSPRPLSVRVSRLNKRYRTPLGSQLLDFPGVDFAFFGSGMWRGDRMIRTHCWVTFRPPEDIP